MIQYPPEHEFTGMEVMNATIALKTSFIELRRCDFCSTMLRYEVDLRHHLIAFHSSCECTRHSETPHLVSWQYLANEINSQPNPAAKKTRAAIFGIELVEGAIAPPAPLPDFALNESVLVDSEFPCRIKTIDHPMYGVYLIPTGEPCWVHRSQIQKID